MISSNSVMAGIGGGLNPRNPAVRRIMQDVLELKKNPSSQYSAAPLEENVFEWHFTIRGPPDSDFDGGRYHGRILLPSEYPFKPPDIILDTPNGRFQVGSKICLSISGFHPETWQPSWSSKRSLERCFDASSSYGAVGLDFVSPYSCSGWWRFSGDYF